MLRLFENNFSKIFIVFFACILALCFVSAAETNTLNSSTGETTMTILPGTYLLTILLVVLLVFGGLVALGYMKNKDLNRGEMRRTIAGTLLVGFTILVFLSLVYDFKNVEIVTAYIQIVGVVIGFYFGTRSALGNKEETTDGINIENIRFGLEDSGKPGKMISVFVRNKGTSNITVDKIYVNGDDYSINFQVSPQKSEKVEVTLTKEWKPKNKYQIKAATTNGFTAEDSITPQATEIASE